MKIHILWVLYSYYHQNTLLYNTLVLGVLIFLGTSNTTRWWPGDFTIEAMVSYPVFRDQWNEHMIDTCTQWKQMRHEDIFPSKKKKKRPALHSPCLNKKKERKKTRKRKGEKMMKNSNFCWIGDSPLNQRCTLPPQWPSMPFNAPTFFPGVATACLIVHDGWKNEWTNSPSLMKSIKEWTHEQMM